MRNFCDSFCRESGIKGGEFYDENEQLDKDELFSLFKEGEGSEYVQAIRKNVVRFQLKISIFSTRMVVNSVQSDLKETKLNFKDISAKAQVTKKQLDQLKEKLEELKFTMGDANVEDKVIEEEEFSLIKELKDLKKDYRAKTNFLKQTKTQIQHLQANVLNVSIFLLPSSTKELFFEQIFNLKIV